MKFKLGQVYKINGVLADVRHINRGYAWLSPLEANPFNGLYKGCASIKLNSKLIDTKGNKAKLYQK